MSMVNVLVTWSAEGKDLERIRSLSDRLKLLPAADEETRLRLAPEAEVWFGWGFTREVFQRAGALRWVQSPSAGVEGLLFEELRRSDVIVTNGSGVWSVSMAEHVVGFMVALSRRFQVCIREQLAGRWPGPAVRWTPEVLAGKTCVILGLGSIGTEVARRVKAFGMEVIGIRRHPARKSSFVDEVVGPERLGETLPRADHLVVSLPLTAETRHIVDADALAAMKPSAYIYNVGRGALIDEGELIKALQGGRLAGAGLDVFEKEPLPEESPLYRLENVIITPHSSGHSPDTREKVFELFCENLKRYLAGEPLLNVVDKQAGY